MSTIGTVLSTRVFAALRNSAVATQAGVAAGTWASTTVPRVFRGFTGFLAGRSRGRLPFVEFDITNIPFVQDTVEGGTVHAQMTIRAHCSGRDQEVAGNLLEAILSSGLAQIRSEAVDNYTALGNDTIGPLVPGAWGLMREATSEIEFTWDRATFDVA